MENENVLYEIGFKFNPLTVVPIIVIILLFAVSVVIWKIKPDLKRIIKIISSCVCLVIIGLSFIFAAKSTKDYQYLMKSYTENTYVTVEGTVSEFYNENGKESFKIGETYFEYTDKFDYGYNKMSNKDGVIKENGQNLKIGYTEVNGVNKIVYIENIPVEE